MSWLLTGDVSQAYQAKKYLLDHDERVYSRWEILPGRIQFTQ